MYNHIPGLFGSLAEGVGSKAVIDTTSLVVEWAGFLAAYHYDLCGKCFYRELPFLNVITDNFPLPIELTPSIETK